MSEKIAEKTSLEIKRFVNAPPGPAIYDAWSSRSTRTIFAVGRSVKRLAS
jgi:hypothetical protein